MGRDRGADMGLGRLDVATLGGTQTGPETELVVSRRERARLDVEASRFVVTALVDELVGAVRQRVRLVEPDEPAKLDKRLGVILDAQRDDRLPGIAAARHNEDRCGLAPAGVSALALGCIERSEETGGQRAGRGRERRQHRRPNAVARHHVRLTRHRVPAGVARERDAAAAGVDSDGAPAVDDRNLAAGGARILGDELLERPSRVGAVLRERERSRPVRDLDVGLGCDGTHSRQGPGHDRPDREPVRLDRDPQFAGGWIPRDYRIRQPIGSTAALYGTLSSVPTLAVLGPGGVGGFLAAALAHAGEDVVVVARGETADVIARDGIDVHSVRLGDFIARPAAVPTLDQPAAVLIVATKAVGLDAALERIESVPGLVVPLLNGLDHMERLRERFGPGRVAAGSIRIEATRPETGRIIQTSQFLRVDLATDDAALAPALEVLAQTLAGAEVPAEIGPSEAQILWSKLVRLNALACTTSAADQPIGFIRADPEWRAALEACIREAAAVANAEGATIDPATGIAELDDAHPELRSSMQRDIVAGREPELDAIPGSVLRAAARHGLECPTIARLSAQIAARAGVPVPRA
jgi:2-dehydropantoate 2-reductase